MCMSPVAARSGACMCERHAAEFRGAPWARRVTEESLATDFATRLERGMAIAFLLTEYLSRNATEEAFPTTHRSSGRRICCMPIDARRGGGARMHASVPVAACRRRCVPGETMCPPHLAAFRVAGGAGLSARATRGQLLAALCDVFPVRE